MASSLVVVEVVAYLQDLSKERELKDLRRGEEIITKALEQMQRTALKVAVVAVPVKLVMNHLRPLLPGNAPSLPLVRRLSLLSPPTWTLSRSVAAVATPQHRTSLIRNKTNRPLRPARSACITQLLRATMQTYQSTTIKEST